MSPKLSEKEQLALRKFKITLEKTMGNEFVEARLFGSKARGDARKDSDMDVLVITASDDWHICDVVYGIVTDILLEDEICISPKVVSKGDYEHLHRIRTSFIRNIIREGIAI